jgi:hypothetical protein
MIGLKAGKCVNLETSTCAMFIETSTVLIAGISLFLAVLFDLFVIIMFCD